MESLRHKAHTCFEMSARAVSMTFATEEAEEDYHKRIMNVFHEFVKEFVEGLTWKEKDKYGIMITKLAICFPSYPSMIHTHAQNLEAQYNYHGLPSFRVILKHKELCIYDIQSKDEVIFTLNF